MTNIQIPYSTNHITVAIPEERLNGILESRAHHYTPEASEEELVQRALANPIASPRLSELVQGHKKIVIITSDHTRPVPTKIISPLLLKEIRRTNPQADITFLVATGFHRASTERELIAKFGEELLQTEKIVMHDCWDADSLVSIGKLPSGGELHINKLIMEADLVIAEGFIEPHLFAGFSGGRKSILPGVVSGETIQVNHCAEFIAHEKARAGILDGNPIHIDMLYAAQEAKLAFIINVVIDADKKIIGAFAGDMEQAHLAGCKFVGELASVEPKPADIVITSNGGYPLDQNIYQLVKGLSSGEATCKRGGIIIICAACNDGHGGEAFYRWYKEATGGAKEIMDKIMRIDRNSTIPDQWAAQIIARIQLKHTVFIVTDQCDHQLIKDMGFQAASTIQEAVEAAQKIAGADASFTVIPDGVAVIIK
ncbi:nickel-dependent lactate racemase [Dendrosporobacter sp. 1207_IL3150]|uniref:nickel-dependent lactate racemase n=1 Tax=Dendrosporobacter sp. 1207_IL3150 TaxID=3084054 RepID=UPI002FD9137B